MLSEQEKTILKRELIQMQRQYRDTSDERDRDESMRDDTGELSLADNHPADAGTELFDRERDRALEDHAEGELEKVENALRAMHDGSYGVCEVCGTDIPFERLEAIPYTNRCIEHADTEIPDDRPVEEEVLEDIMDPVKPDTFEVGQEGGVQDDQDSFRVVAQYGTSETPSDMTGDHDDYNRLYEDGLETGAVEEYEEFASSDETGTVKGFTRSETMEDYEEKLDDEQLESPMGDIPYHKRDSYTGEVE
ncbi:TraR/DksA C4-type zinc finger protein [Edaphobacillus lindanitolerans]|uniref:Transcriptional regulator, TraR/DksA family n=1 Tax=Edaphobacillus lindanitolerans TaxID=550447 RepID=A0A1U7PQN0_9BACI|nr:TraR/DksA C4-type zinc finger protein [Edaphobacillus lindanitolerans]SIT85842.1 transcriptional regulator, TraR/DksA family [Edaphobacillus lindanitolerans]